MKVVAFGQSLLKEGPDIKKSNVKMKRWIGSDPYELHSA
jgi:hypothetical protein